MKMKRLCVDNKFAVYLNHRQLINENYAKNFEDTKESFELKEEIFYFIQKEQQQKINSDDTKRNRKRRRGNDENTTTNESIEKEREWCNNVLAELKSPNTTTAKENLSRYWEDSHEFPQFMGANTTSTHQTTTFGEHSYIIPPQCRFFNYDVRRMTQLLPQLAMHGGYDLIVLDPPWRNKFIRRLKKARQTLAYSMLSNAELNAIPLKHLTHQGSLVAIWCTNAEQHQRALLEELLGAWHLRLLHSMKWYKLNTNGSLIGALCEGTGKQPYEMLYLACHQDAAPDFGVALRADHALFSVPSIIHSHKPPLLQWLSRALPAQPKCLEIFARYLQPECTAIGLEVLKLMDTRLYDAGGGRAKIENK